MQPSGLTALLGAALVLGPGLGEARDLSLDKLNYTQDARAPYANPQRPLAWMDLTPRKPLDRPYSRLAREQTPETIPTAVSYRLSRDGPVGSLGFVRLGASHAIDPAMLSNAVANQPGAPDETVGAALRYAFR
jgi:hypothetical protein